MQSFSSPRQPWHRAGARLAAVFQALGLPRLWAWSWAWVLLPLALILAAPLPAQAQTAGEMLFLTPTASLNPALSPPAVADTSPEYFSNALAAFSSQAQAANLGFVDGTGWLSSTTPLSIPADTKLIVVVTHTNAVNPDRMTDLINVLTSRPDLAIVIFADGCCQAASNLAPLIAAINTIRPADWPTLTLGARMSGITNNYIAPLNTASLYASTFAAAGLPTIAAGDYSPINGVLLNYALYTQAALPASPPDVIGTNCSSANKSDCVVGLFMPQTASNGGQGACLFLTADASEFSSSHASQYLPIAKAFTDAALDPNGACAQPVAGAPDLWVSLSTLASPIVGVPFTVTLTVGDSAEGGVAASTDGQVKVTLPPELSLAGIPTVPGCTGSGSSGGSFVCTLNALEPGATATFDFEVTASTQVTNSTITAEVSEVTGEVNLSNNSATLEGIATTEGTPDLAVKLSAASNLLLAREPATISFTVSNVSAERSHDGQVDVTLPGSLELVGNPPTGCTAAATATTPGSLISTVLSCNLPDIAADGSLEYQFQVVAPVALLTNVAIQAQITGVTNEVNNANNEDTLLVTSPYIPLNSETAPAQPVPTLGQLALALLALLLVGSAAAGWRRKG